MASDPTKNYVTLSELRDKLNGFRWEMRCYVLLMTMAVLAKLHVPQGVAAFARHLVN